MIREKEIIEQVDIELNIPVETRFSLLFVVDRLEIFGGLETYLLTLCRELKKRGHGVYINCNYMSSVIKEEFAFAEVLENKSMGFMENFIRTHKIDIIHTQPYVAAQRALALHRGTGVPYVITWHGPYYTKDFPEVSAQAERIICVSEEAYAILSGKYPLAEQKLVIIQNGVDLEELRPVEKGETSGEVTFIGRGGTDRLVGLRHLIDGFLKTSFNCLNICGVKNDGGFPRDPRINYLGEIAEIKTYVEKADVVVATGRGVREALACGKPCIVMSNWGYDGIVMPKSFKKQEYANFSGRGVGEPLVAERVTADLNLLSSVRLREKLGIYGRWLGESYYDIRQITCRVEEVYRQVVENRRLPKVSVLLPVYNHADIAGQCIDSLLKQTYGDFELIIINDGSTDSLNEVVKKYRDERIRYVSRSENRGLPKTLNEGLRLSRGRYITWTSADNLHHPRYLEKLVTVLERRPACGSVYSDYNQIDRAGRFIQRMSKGKYRLNGKVNYGPSFLYRIEAVNRVGFFDENLFGTEDRDYSIRMAIAAPVYWLPEVLYEYRIHEKSLTGRWVNKQIDFNPALEAISGKWKWLLAQPDDEPYNLNAGAAIYGRTDILRSAKDCTLNSNWRSNLDRDPIFIGRFRNVTYRHLTHFDLNDYTPDLTVVRGLFQFFCIRNDNNIPRTIGVYEVKGPWREREVYWGNEPDTAPKPAVQAPTGEIYGWVSFDITGLVRKWIESPCANHGICLKFIDETAGLCVAGYNRHHYNVVATPRLIIETTGKSRCMTC